MASSFSGAEDEILVGDHRALVGTLSATTGTITGATAADPVVISDTSHGLSTGDYIRITGIVGMTQLNNRDFLIEVVDANSFKLKGEDGSAHTAYSSGGTWTKYTMTDLGYTEGGSSLTIGAMWRDRTGDQDGETVLNRVLNGDKAEGSLTLKQSKSALLALAFGTSGGATRTAAGTSSPARIQGGGSLAGSVQALTNAVYLVLHPMDVDDDEVHGEWRFFKVVNDGDIAVSKPQGEDQTFVWNWKALPDQDRTRGLRTWAFFDPATA